MERILFSSVFDVLGLGKKGIRARSRCRLKANRIQANGVNWLETSPVRSQFRANALLPGIYDGAFCCAREAGGKMRRS
ncbi:hypothetical protein LC049_15295 [Nitratireductor aquimarinus]|uniref:hypothetical protein n=1 Tax=Nitratireductor TaxID=245876 RepID=UPI0019D40452|nr:MULTISPECIES: hypothetical protein [Nitratireductor]MBY6024406.1 hypothetical protein [Nitratireductor sp. DP7N14-4]MCV0351313.1 hypothetical protein [Nitratireductor sp.]MBN7761386.1 hypothetical protein [Nitratireductor aquibiodomus]MBN7782891.1 hypothetical protein [Nitratireductor pacificus]MBY6100955.1 hypothetical protein [Nitratireductor aquimarinus]